MSIYIIFKMKKKIIIFSREVYKMHMCEIIVHRTSLWYGSFSMFFVCLG